MSTATPASGRVAAVSCKPTHSLGKLSGARDADGELVRKAGVMAIVVSEGEVRACDPIRVELPAAPFRPLVPV
jgi:MOSC domain-containing protein YiiM